MQRSELYKIRKKWFGDNWEYECTKWNEFDFSIFDQIMYKYKRGRGSNDSYNDCIVMADTETSKKAPNKKDEKGKYIPVENHVVAWTISVRAFDVNICTLYGNKPSEFCECLKNMKDRMPGTLLYLYFHNLCYDYLFLRKFLFKYFGTPEKQLNTKPHYPILLQFENGIIIKDSLILAQRGLEKWASDMDVEHKKAVGKWNYDKIRTQNEIFTPDEIEYIEHDTLSGVECIQKTLDILHKDISSIPYTATGIPREEVRNRGKEHNAHDQFVRQAFTWEQQQIAEMVYHGGYTHGNRHLIEEVQKGMIKCYDFASSYPFVLLSEKYACEKFVKTDDCCIDFILENAERYAYMFELVLVDVRLKSDDIVMPALQLSKATNIINPIVDNGRIIAADMMSIWITEQDLIVIHKQYVYKNHICKNVNVACKDYLPRWFTDYIFKLFEDKTMLKGGDKVLYSIAKAKLNSCYGMCVQKPVKDNLQENFETGEYINEVTYPEYEYDKYVKRHNSVLPYNIGVWCTAYAFKNLFTLGSCCQTWIYSDTDSCYGIGWDEEKLSEYNENCKKKLKDNGYGCVNYNNREYWLGVAEFDGEYSEYKVLGSKRYCGRSTEDNELHITVAGVPKVGAKCLNDNIDNFTAGFIFPGTETTKKTHMYIYVDEIYVDNEGNETGDSIDLLPCDYLLDSVSCPSWEELFTEEINIQVYEGE